MQVSSTALPDVKIIVPRVCRDERGSFSETYNRLVLLERAGIDAIFVQDNHSWSEQAGVVRGLHFQLPPNAQAKLVRVVRGAIFDVAVDIRRGSPTYGQHVSMRLTDENRAQAWIPIGFAHGFCTLQPGTEVAYKVTAPYDPACDRGLAWDDPRLDIKWPVAANAAILSDKDRRQPPLSDLAANFNFEDAL